MDQLFLSMDRILHFPETTQGGHSGIGAYF
jgi:hypothetical protein